MGKFKLVLTGLVAGFTAFADSIPLRPLALGHHHRTASVFYDASECDRTRRETPRFEAATRYAQSMLEAIVAANPEAFVVARDLCVVVDAFDTPDPLYAESYPHHGMIQLSTSLVRAAADDSELAAILTHELAHLTLQHGEAELGDESSPWWPKHLKRVQAWRSELALHLEEKELEKKIREERARRPFIEETWRALKRQKYKVHDRGLEAYVERVQLEREIHEMQEKAFAPEFVTRWREQEADQVGYELFLRSGFSSARFTWLFERNALHEDLRLIDVLTRDLLDPILYAKKTAEYPTEQVVKTCEGSATMPSYTRDGLENYPTYCWRAWNIHRNLQDYRQVVRPASNAPPRLFPTLDEAKRNLTTRE